MELQVKDDKTPVLRLQSEDEVRAGLEAMQVALGRRDQLADSWCGRHTAVKTLGAVASDLQRHLRGGLMWNIGMAADQTDREWRRFDITGAAVGYTQMGARVILGEVGQFLEHEAKVDSALNRPPTPATDFAEYNRYGSGVIEALEAIVAAEVTPPAAA